MDATLILLRHGQSQANADGLFTGLLDVPLTDVGRAEAARAAHRLNEEHLGAAVCFTSPLRRATESAAILARELVSPPVIEEDWRLAERHYGALTSRTKASVRKEYGEEQFLLWRRSMHVAPPPMSPQQRAVIAPAPEWLGLTESLADVIIRVADVWQERILPALHRGSAAIVVAHGNSLRALCCLLDDLSEDQVRDLNIPTGHPLVYRIGADGRPVIPGGTYLDPDDAHAAAATIAREGGT